MDTAGDRRLVPVFDGMIVERDQVRDAKLRVLHAKFDHLVTERDFLAKAFPVLCKASVGKKRHIPAIQKTSPGLTPTTSVTRDL